MDNTKDFKIETEDLEIDDECKEEVCTPQQKPIEKKKRNFVFTEKRAEALKKGRQKRAENLRKQKEDLKELEQIRKNKSLETIKEEDPIIITKPKKKIIKEKIQYDSEDNTEVDSEYEEEIVYKRKPKPKPKPKKKKVKKIIYLSSSEDEEDDMDYREYKRTVKPSIYSKMIKK